MTLSFLISCGGEPQPRVPLVVPTTPVDSIATIELPEVDTSEREVISSIEVGEGYLSILSTTTNMARHENIQSLYLEFKDGDVIAVEINKKRSKTNEVPFEYLGDNKVRVKSGATLKLIARYYGTTVGKLMMCNNLESGAIREGQILKTKCCCD